MATAIKIWEIDAGSLKPTVSSDFAAEHKEAELESWITANPEILGEKILLIDRQRDVPGVGIIDLLGIDGDGRLIVIELKRDLSSREAVAQALDYASWLDSESPTTIVSLAESFLKKSLADAFFELFQVDLPEINCQNHRILLVAGRLDASAERIINYLSERHEMDINAAFFTYAKLVDGREVLARSMLIPEEVHPPTSGGKRPSVEVLLAQAAEGKTLQIVEECRKAGVFWREERNWKYDGTFLYWADTPSGTHRSVIGLNAGGRYQPPNDQLDVYVVVKNLAEITGVAEDEIRQELKNNHPVRDMWVNECWLRLKSSADAEKLILQLQNWLKQSVKSATA